MYMYTYPFSHRASLPQLNVHTHTLIRQGCLHGILLELLKCIHLCMYAQRSTCSCIGLYCRGAELGVCVTYETDPAMCAAVQWLEPAQTAGKKLPYLYTQCQVSTGSSILKYNINSVVYACTSSYPSTLILIAAYPCPWDAALPRHSLCEEHLLC